jgi:hypothetical protein
VKHGWKCASYQQLKKRYIISEVILYLGELRGLATLLLLVVFERVVHIWLCPFFFFSWQPKTLTLNVNRHQAKSQA